MSSKMSTKGCRPLFSIMPASLSVACSRGRGTSGSRDRVPGVRSECIVLWWLFCTGSHFSCLVVGLVVVKGHARIADIEGGGHCRGAFPVASLGTAGAAPTA